jgi:hypothetical protein
VLRDDAQDLGGVDLAQQRFSAPAWKAAIAQPLPAMWKSGIATRFTLRASSDHAAVPSAIAERRFRWVSSTPFGRPVVPEV